MYGMRARTLVGLVACVLLLVHVLLGVLIVVRPEASEGSRLLTFYRRLIVLGPFFQEARIVSSPHLLVRYQKHGTWSDPIDPGCVEVALTGGEYRALKNRSFEEFLGSRVIRDRRASRNRRALRELEHYLRWRAGERQADSLEVAFIFRRQRMASHESQGEVYADTMFVHRFKR